MTLLADDTRFQNLPPEEVREQIRKSAAAANLKYILLEQTEWYNTLTRCKHIITNMPIFAIQDCSARTRAVTEIKVVEYIDGHNTETAHYIYNSDYTHQNIAYKYNPVTNAHSGSCGFYTINDCDNENKKYKIEYEEICCPITMHHFYTMKQEEITLLFKGQLMGQNGGSPFRSIHSVAGTYMDKKLCEHGSGPFIKRSAPILQLLSLCSLQDLHNNNTLVEILQGTPFPKDGQIAYKNIEDDTYSIVSPEEYNIAVANKKASAYYPVITAEMCKELIENIPKVEVDFGCFGLGSAGTGVLDLLARSTFFEKYMIADFDYVETKNLRNQWYTNNQAGSLKVTASRTNTIQRNPKIHSVIAKASRFQEIDFSIYDFKYVMSAFDSIDTRLEFLNTITDEKSKAKYLIDARYDDLTASLFFIDLEKEEEIDFYRKGLMSDKEVFDKLEAQRQIKNEDEFIQYLEEHDCFTNNCGSCKDELKSLVVQGMTPGTDEYLSTYDKACTELYCPRHKFGMDASCKGTDCVKAFKDFYNNHIDKCNTLKLKREESSCLRQNFIDIYHFASTYIYGAIRLIEDNKDKPFTQIDVTTDPVPNAMLLRR